ncbi:hypothetical protein SSYRP_v1c08830 [Spiroplasma syrphidicola EA-1]|uniref:Uncharacterized protein n=1 Tax=Spiroplasma syrphidicola EA-1 TaxID=1276229 RepID=R4U4R7_9MOLU|nr:hypothetical protein [Spiroplasma syrphidicola]AGM26472.1 hypothetical protein SSYRP_v1c08830 [Spiroplasma syrphidicola EA-1]
MKNLLSLIGATGLGFAATAPIIINNNISFNSKKQEEELKSVTMLHKKAPEKTLVGEYKTIDFLSSLIFATKNSLPLEQEGKEIYFVDTKLFSFSQTTLYAVWPAFDIVFTNLIKEQRDFTIEEFYTTKEITTHTSQIIFKLAYTIDKIIYTNYFDSLPIDNNILFSEGLRINSYFDYQ